MSLLPVSNVGPRSRGSMIALAGLVAVLLSACATKPEPKPAPVAQQIEDLQVEIFEPEPVVELEPIPSITIEEYERLQREALAADQAVLDAQAEAEEAEQAAARRSARRARLAAEQAAKSPLERAAESDDPDEKIKLLADAGNEADVLSARIEAYRGKLVKDKAAGNSVGQAEAMVFLGDAERAIDSRAGKLEALRQYAEAQKLDAENLVAPVRISSVRAELQSYADSLHAEAVKLYAVQDFVPAIERWEIVLLIDPGNTAARNYFEQSKTAVAS